MEKNEAKGVYNLVFPVVRPGDAGVYECQDESGQGSKASAQLIVLDTTPVCEPRFVTHEIIGPNICGTEPNQLIISCRVDSKGNEAPIMKWIRASDNKSVSEGVANRTIDNKRVVYSMTIKGNSSVKDGESYSCITTRSATVNYGCTTGNITVKGTAVLGPTKKSNQEQSPRRKTPEEIELIGKQDKETIKKLTADKETIKKLTADKETPEKLAAADKETIAKLTAENIRLIAKVNVLELELYYSDKKAKNTAAKLAHTIVTKAANKTDEPLTGMAILNSDLFVVKKDYPVVEVYDSETFVYVRLLENLNLTNPLDIASSKENKFLYVIDRVNGESESIIWKFNNDGVGGKAWTTENDYGRLSTYESHLIVCFSTKRIIIEYTPEGEAVNTVRLSPGNGFNKLWHAVKLTGTHFVVSHSMAEDAQRVCVVDINGSVLATCEKLPALPINLMIKNHFPICLVGQRDESVIVADARNNRVSLLSPQKLGRGDVLIKTDEQMPVRLCLNESKDRLFVGVNSGEYSKPETWKEGCILIYNLSK